MNLSLSVLRHSDLLDQGSRILEKYIQDFDPGDRRRLGEFYSTTFVWVFLSYFRTLSFAEIPSDLIYYDKVKIGIYSPSNITQLGIHTWSVLCCQKSTHYIFYGILRERGSRMSNTGKMEYFHSLKRNSTFWDVEFPVRR